MAEKFWRRTDDWYAYANCYGLPDFTTPAERNDGGPVADIDIIHTICDMCRVRPECARAACDEEWNDVWVCGVWIPGHDIDRREAKNVRQNLLDSIPNELDARGDDV